MICCFKLNIYMFFLSNVPHFLPLFKYFIIWRHYFWFYYDFCNEIYKHSIYLIKIYTEPSGLLFWKFNL